MLGMEGQCMKKVLVTPYRENGRLCIHSDYLNAIMQEGLVPLVLPITMDERVLTACLQDGAGLLLTGGGDVAPALYGEERDSRCGEADALRDGMEFFLCRAAHERNLPTLGICRGLQVMNCGLGGTLHQHVAFAQTHQRSDRPAEKVHTVGIKQGSLLHRILQKDEIGVNSRHHQGVKGLGIGLKASAFAQDGLTEAAEDPGKRFFLGVQWHPESMCPTDENAGKIFAAFAAAVREER